MYFFLTITFLFLNSCQINEEKDKTNKSESVSKSDTCDSPDSDIECSFVGMPDNPGSLLKIAGENEPGKRMLIKCRILQADSITPVPLVYIYAYHTDNNGYYTKQGNERGAQKWHGKLHGWAMTDSEGNFEINTIRPARYPDNIFPAHIHAVLKIPDWNRTFYINDFVFKDDSLVNERYVNSLNMPGGTGIIDLIQREDDIFYGERIIILNKEDLRKY